MPQARVLGPTGEEVRQIDLADVLFAAPVNETLIHQAAVRQLAGRRAGTVNTLTRGEVSGGGAKPWRQKGTGRARQGSRRAPHWKGGGDVFGPHPRSYEQAMPVKMRRAALRGVLSAKQAEGRVHVVESFGLDAIKTRSLRERLAAWQVSGNVLLVLPERDPLVERSSRNLPDVRVVLADSLNVVDLLDADAVVFTPAALARAEEVYR